MRAARHSFGSESNPLSGVRRRSVWWPRESPILVASSRSQSRRGGCCGDRKASCGPWTESPGRMPGPARAPQRLVRPFLADAWDPNPGYPRYRQYDPRHDLSLDSPIGQAAASAGAATATLRCKRAVSPAANTPGTLVRPNALTWIAPWSVIAQLSRLPERRVREQRPPRQRLPGGEHHRDPVLGPLDALDAILPRGDLVHRYVARDKQRAGRRFDLGRAVARTATVPYRSSCWVNCGAIMVVCCSRTDGPEIQAAGSPRNPGDSV